MSKSRVRSLCLALLSSALACTEVTPDARESATNGEPVQGISQAATGPEGFVDELLTSGLSSPTAFAFAPDGRIFVAEQAGRVRVVRNGALLATPLVSLPVNSDGERGLLGIAIDPNFASAPHIYVFYTAASASPRNRVSRLRVEGDVAPPSSESVLLELDPINQCTIHMGGALNFAPDGHLFIGVGDLCEPTHVPGLDRFAGKMLRIRADGTIPSDNPFYASATGSYRAIWARGLRNPYTFAISRSGRIFINDVGLETWEEINEGRAGAHYGWPESEGMTNVPGHTSPVFVYPHSGAQVSGCAVTGGTFYDPEAPQFPGEYWGKYLFTDYCAGFIRTLDPNSHVSAPFVREVAGAVDLQVGNDGMLYRLERGTNSISRLRYAAHGQAPVVDAAPADRSVASGASVTLTVRASGTPPLRYQWQRNGLDIAGATSADYTFIARSADHGSLFRVVVSNANGSVTSAAATLRVLQNSAPRVEIQTPGPGEQYSAGSAISYAGAASDAEDGPLPASAFTWEVVLHHDQHTHPFLAPIRGQSSGSFVVPRVGHTETNVFYRIHLRVRDSAGLESATYRDISPRLATLALRTDPPGLVVTVDGSPVATPADIPSVVGVTRSLGVVSPQSVGANTYHFRSWSDAGAATHTVDTPTGATVYTASFQATCLELPVRAIAASSSSNESAALGPENAIDGNSATRWSSAFADAQWLLIDLGATQPLRRAVLHWEVAHARDYQLQVSDSPTGPFQTVAARTNFAGGIDTFPSLAQRGRYLRVYASTRATIWGNSLWEVQVFAAAPNCEPTGAVCGNGVVEQGEQCDDRNATSGDGCSANCTVETSAPCVEQRLPIVAAQASSSASAGLAPAFAVDQAFGTRWASTAADGQWIVADLGSPRLVSRVLLHWEVSYARDYRVEIGDSASGPWTAIAARTDHRGGGDYFPYLAGRGRYLRVLALTHATSSGISLWELELFGDLDVSCRL